MDRGSFPRVWVRGLRRGRSQRFNIFILISATTWFAIISPERGSGICSGHGGWLSSSLLIYTIYIFVATVW
jgi:hypothetical protein